MMRASSIGPVFCLALGLFACGDDTSAPSGSGGGSSGSTTGGEGGSGGNPCFPDTCNGPSSSGMGGAGGAGGSPSCPEEVACGDEGLACDPTTEFCESFSGGPQGSGTTYTCVPVGACETDDCECLMDASPDAFGCTPPGDDCLATVTAAGA